MNIVERERLDELIPLCLEKGVGITIMKPLATGLLPATLSLKWLLNHPISTVVPGTTTIEEVEENSMVGHLEDIMLSRDEENQVNLWAKKLENVRCRMCMKCEPCPVGIPISDTLGSDDIYDHYRTMGTEAFTDFPWSSDTIGKHREWRLKLIDKIESCDNCKLCQEKCPYGLPVVRMLKDILPSMKDMLRIWDLKGL